MACRPLPRLTLGVASLLVVLQCLAATRQQVDTDHTGRSATPALTGDHVHRSSKPQNGADWVRVVESSQTLSWAGVGQLSELAPESQVVGVRFELMREEPLNPRSEGVNKTKQSQEFETHQQAGGARPTGTTALGLPASSESPISSSTSSPSTTTAVTTTTTTSTSTTSTPTTTTTAQIYTTVDIGGWPLTSSTSPAPTSESVDTPPTSIAPVGSRTERQGAAVLCGEANANGKSNKRLISDRIVGGHKTEPGEFPFQVRLNIRSRRGSGICGGVVLDQRHILTAAHCMTACVSQHLTTATIESSGVRATLGDHSIKSDDGEQELEVESITPHEKYDACNFYANDHDIAIIKTTTNIEYRFTTDGYGSINRPCMPKHSSQMYADGEQVIVSGWGVTRENSGALSNILRYVQVPVVNVAKCQDTYGARVTKNHVCAGLPAGGKDSCQGDSGGPLVRVVENRYELVGIVSFGYGCGQPGAPGVYTRVASYIDWIKANL